MQIFLIWNLKNCIAIFEINTLEVRERIKIPRKKIKISKFGTQNALFEYFGLRNFKKLLSNLKSAPSNQLEMSLGIAFAYSKVPGFAFSEGPAYRVCHVVEFNDKIFLLHN